MTAISEALPDGETVRERLALRTGGSVVLSDDFLLVVTGEGSGDPDLTRVALDDVAEVTVEEFDYFLAVLSVLLVGYGLYSVPRSAALGLAFAAFGAASLYWTYRKRGKARIKVEGRAKPISLFPADTDAFTSALRPLLEVETGDGGESE
ncbi:hypothetical protein M0R89_19430 (plasmid) [Halorussus limi]|uniref:Uncharacterized protein n=1 Tax=Halorussus limi TaxID=2938695 RepID=A0A8U0I074_9EURY|nr:hypothetical protein [Halorussus limi]UPV76336.1 hypothetical protein M0R89_19430 [Halorussus limi]